MIYQYDQALQLPTVDLYDTQIMAMALQAAKDMYDRGEQQVKDFQKNFGDFLTPITADQNWWNQNVTGRVRDAINQMYARGGDPLRNAQDRAQISMLINNMPYGDMAFKRQRAENAKEYYKAAGALAAQNKYNKDFAEFLGEDPNQWADDYMGITAPTQFQTLKEATNDWYDNRTAGDLTPQQMKKLGLDPRYSWKAYLDSDLMRVAQNQTPGWQGTPQAAYYRELAKRQLQAQGNANPTQDQIEATLQRNIADAQQEWIINPTKGDADAFVLDDYRTANDIRAHQQKAAIDHYYKQLENNNPGDGEDGSGSGYSLLKDVYVTSIAQTLGIPFLPSDGVDSKWLKENLELAKQKQKGLINSTKDVFKATGIYINPEKIEGLIPSQGKNYRGYFLNQNNIGDLHMFDEIRTSYKGWRSGDPKATKVDSDKAKAQYIKDHEDFVTAARNEVQKKEHKGSRRVKVVPMPDENNKNVYCIFGSDNRWHTYARVRVYISDGKETYNTSGKYKFKNKNNEDAHESWIPAGGRDMLLEVGLRSNENAATPDLSVNERERVGFSAYDWTKGKIGKEGNKDWPAGTNTMK